MSYKTRSKISTLDEVYRTAMDPNARSIIVPFGPDNDPTSKTLNLTYRELGQKITELSTYLYNNYGINKGDVVSTFYGNGLTQILSFLSIVSMGITAAPLNPAYKRDSLSFYFKDTNPKLILVPIKSSPLINECISTAISHNIQVLRFNINLNNGKLMLQNVKKFNHNKSNNILPKASPNDVALILHTSGTTGKPKGVPLKHKNICRTVYNIVNHYELTSNDSCHVVMPLFHVHGLIGCLLSTLTSGGTAVIQLNKFSNKRFWKQMYYCNCSWYSAVPTIHQILLKSYESNYLNFFKKNGNNSKTNYLKNRFRFVRSCSAALPSSVLYKLEKQFNKPYLEAYAMTECSHQICANPLPKNGVHKPASVGLPVGVKVLILNNDNIPLKVGEIGEISVQGSNVTDGYLNRPDANKKCFVPVKNNGIYFRTGDQGKIDEDGYVYLTGRLKEMINRGGEKIAPLEIDNVILRHENVSVAVAFGVPDEMYGEAVNCAVVLKDNSVDRNKMKAEILKLCKKNLAKYKVPVKVFISDDVPRTATGKIQRRIVAKYFLDKLKAKL